MKNLLTNTTKSAYKGIIFWTFFWLTVFSIAYAASITSTTQTITSWDSITANWYQEVNDKIGGISVSGVDLKSTNNIVISSSNPILKIEDTDGPYTSTISEVGSNMELNSVSWHMRFRTGSSWTENMRISPGWDVTFYEDTWTNGKMIWDASTERLGIGTTTPEYPLHVKGEVAFWDQTTSYSKIYMSHNTTDAQLWSWGNKFEIQWGGKTRVSVNTNNGNVWIWTVNPNSKLEVTSNVNRTSIDSNLDAWSNHDIQIRSDNVADSNILSIGFAQQTSWSWADSAITSKTLSPGNTRLWFWTENNNSSAERVSINNNGNVGIWTTGPKGKLSVELADSEKVRIWRNTWTNGFTWQEFWQYNFSNVWNTFTPVFSLQKTWDSYFWWTLEVVATLFRTGWGWDGCLLKSVYSKARATVGDFASTILTNQCQRGTAELDILHWTEKITVRIRSTTTSEIYWTLIVNHMWGSSSSSHWMYLIKE